MIAAIIQARMLSTRLPGKALLDLSGRPVLMRVVERTQRSKLLDTVIVATSTNAADDAIVALCEKEGVAVFRGSEDDVLARYAGAAKANQCDTVVRITSDCPLVDPHVIDMCIEALRDHDYAANTLDDRSTFPRGLDVEVFTSEALYRSDREAREKYEREHVTPYIWEHPEIFEIGPTIEAPAAYARDYRLTVDYLEDYELMRRIYEHFHDKGSMLDVPEVLSFLDKNPDWVAINAHCVQKSLTA